ncbi:MAG: hypothetical protein WBJ46_08280, partial [Rectinema sp.]
MSGIMAMVGSRSNRNESFSVKPISPHAWLYFSKTSYAKSAFARSAAAAGPPIPQPTTIALFTVFPF